MQREKIVYRCDDSGGRRMLCDRDRALELKQMNEAIERLYKRRRFGIKPGLEVETKLLELLGNPQQLYPAIHIAGTNGKGSVAAMLASILSHAGYRTGLYTSPHLVRFNERFLIDGVPVSDSDLEDAVQRIESQVPAVAETEGNEPTFFECSTAIAFEYFASRRIDLAVLETGMGGRLDATNVVTPLVAAITRIGLEHTAFLGKDLESIALEKAGIIKPGRPVVCAMMDDTACAVIRRVAHERKAPCIDAGQSVSVRVLKEDLTGQRLAVESETASYGRLQLPLAGRHQVENVATVVATVETLNGLCGLAVSESAVKDGLETVSWPGRLQLIRRDPPVILDGAHNPDAARSLAASLKRLSRKRPLALVAGMCSDKDARSYLSAFGGMVERLWTVSLRNERGMPAEELLAIGRSAGFQSESCDLKQALESAVKWAEEAGGMVCVTGSLFLVGEVLELEGKQ